MHYISDKIVFILERRIWARLTIAPLTSLRRSDHRPKEQFYFLTLLFLFYSSTGVSGICRNCPCAFACNDGVS